MMQAQTAEPSVEAPVSVELDDELGRADGLMTQAAYARHRGCTRQAVNKLVGAEKIPVHLGDKGEILIDPAEADFALQETRERLDEPREPAVEPSADTQKLTAARAKREGYLAKTAQLQYAERVNQVVPVDQVADAGVLFAATIVRTLETLPMFAEEITAAASKDGVAGARIALKGIVHTLRTRAAKAAEELAKNALAQQDKANAEAEGDEPEGLE
jgi:hypothetical protein